MSDESQDAEALDLARQLEAAQRATREVELILARLHAEKAQRRAEMQHLERLERARAAARPPQPSE